MSDLDPIVLRSELAHQFEGLAYHLGEGALTTQSFASLAIELRELIQIEALMASAVVQRRFESSRSDSVSGPGDYIQLYAPLLGRKWRAMGESFRRLFLPALAEICGQLEQGWRSAPYFEEEYEEAWRRETTEFAHRLVGRIHRLAREHVSA